MNRSVVIVLSLLLTTTFCTAQKNQPEQLSPTSKSRDKIIALAAEDDNNGTKLPFSAIEVRDVRPDTSKLGFYRSTKDRRHYKYRFANAAQEHIGTFLNNHFRQQLDADADARLVIYIKKLWLSEFDSSELNTHNTHVRNAWLYLTSEIYLQTKDAYQAVYRFDSVIYVRKGNSYTSGGFIAENLLQSMDRLQRVDFTQVQHKRPLTQEQVDAYYQQYAANTATIKPPKGVYLTFNDFKNHRPTYTDFNVKFESLADVVYVKEADGQYYPKKNIWGISDGEHVFIRMAANYFPLYNQQNTWEFYGSAALDARGPRIPVVLGAGLPMTIASAGAAQFTSFSEKQLVNMRAFQVDIENGKFY